MGWGFGKKGFLKKEKQKTKMGKLVKKVSKDLYSSTFIRRSQKGGQYLYPVYRGRMRGGIFPLTRLVGKLQGLVKTVGRNTIRELKREVIKRGVKAAPDILIGKKSLSGVAKNNIGGVAKHMVKSLPKIVGEALFDQKKPKPKKKKGGVKKKPKGKKKSQTKQKGGVHTLYKKGGNLNHKTNVFGDAFK